jgi:hypothetical protein
MRQMFSVCAVCAFLSLLSTGCAQLVQKPKAPEAARAAPSQTTGAGIPAQATGTAGASAPSQAAGIGFPVQASDTAVPTQKASGAGSTQLSEQETVAPKQASIGLNNQFVFNILTGSTGGLLVLTALVLLFRTRSPRVPAKLARRVGALLSVAVEKAAGDHTIRDLIGELAPKLGVTEAEIQRFRELVGTAPKAGERS